MELFERIKTFYFEYEDREKDTRCEGYPLMETPSSLFMIIGLYLTAVFLGPRWMHNRKPYSLKKFTDIYNIFQIIFCAFMILSFIVLTEVGEGIPLQCKVFRRDVTPKAEKIAFLIYLNLVVRIVEFSETIVFILKKKARQLTFLHVYHHVFNSYLAWVTAKFQAGGSASTICLINFMVHFVMYTYYYTSSSENPVIHALSAKVKRYVTLMQLAQFIYMLMIGAQSLLLPSCYTPAILWHSFMFHVLANLYLFSKFYKSNFTKQEKKEA